MMSDFKALLVLFYVEYVIMVWEFFMKNDVYDINYYDYVYIHAYA